MVYVRYFVPTTYLLILHQDTTARISRRFSISTGFFVISSHYISFWTKTLRASDSKYRFPINKVVGAKSRMRMCHKSWGMVLGM